MASNFFATHLCKNYVAIVAVLLLCNFSLSVNGTHLVGWMSVELLTGSTCSWI